MKRIRWVALWMTLVLALQPIGCRKDPSSVKITSIRIGVTVYDQYDVFISQMMTVFNEYATRMSKETDVAISVDLYNAAGSQQTQNNQVKNMINNDFDIICVNLVDRTDAAYIINLAIENDTPIIFFNRELVAEDLERSEKFYYVGASALESGVMEGELIAEYWREHPEADQNRDGVMQYVLMEGEAGHQDAIVRTEYSVGTLEEKGIATGADLAPLQLKDRKYIRLPYAKVNSDNINEFLTR